MSKHKGRMWLLSDVAQRGSILAVVLLAVTAGIPQAQAISVTVDGEALKTSAPPKEVAGHTLVGMRDLFERIGAVVAWEPSQKMITLTRGTEVVVLWIGRTSARVNGDDKPMGVAPKLIDGRTYVPARVPCEGLGATVGWVPATRTVTVSTAKQAGETKTVTLPGGATLELVWVPGGSFMMGSDDWYDGEKPIHGVELDGFWIGKTEVTVAQWRSVVGSIPPANNLGDDHPVTYVSWEDAQSFCGKAGLLLPTEAQWEYAARGPKASPYPWGDTWDKSLCQSPDDLHGHERTAPAGSLPGGASWCGALDMVGNLWEWCSDRGDYAFYESAAATVKNPVNTDASIAERITRGGSWNGDARTCRPTIRLGISTDSRSIDQGFRVSQAD